MNVKVISLYQPWATLVVIGAKQFETRSWATTYRGPLLIHASKKFPKDCRQLTFSEPFRTALEFKSWTILPTGSIVGRVDLLECFKIGTDCFWKGPQWSERVDIDLSEQEKAFGNYTEGRFAWQCDNPVAFAEPIPAKGLQRIWNFPESALGHLAERSA